MSRNPPIPPIQFTGPLQIRHRCGVCRVPIDVDDSRLNPAQPAQSQAEKAFRGNRIAVWPEKEVDGVAGRVDGSVQVCPLTGNANIGFIAALRNGSDCASRIESAHSVRARTETPLGQIIT